MRVYQRYIDDSNQIPEKLPPGYKYDRKSQKAVFEQEELAARVEEKADCRMARILKHIANSIDENIQMEDDYPSKNDDNRLAILDLKGWKDDSNFMVFKHYEKKVASKKVLHASSAQSSTCKKSVHVQEVLRRLLNCSSRLDRDSEVAPVVTDYMARMKDGGYNEGCRKYSLGHALCIYDKMKEDATSGVRPMFRPREGEEEERRISTKRKRRGWSEKGGYIAPIFVPPTPGGKLFKVMKEVAEREAVGRLKLKIVESGGTSVKRKTQRSNPTATAGCSSPECQVCKEGKGKGGNCRRSNVQYEMHCRECPETNPTVYLGETSRNLYTRTAEHMNTYRRRLNGGKKESFILQHQQDIHDGAEPNFTSKVTKSFSDCLTRQISEAVHISRNPSA